MSVKPIDLKIASNSLYPLYRPLFQVVIDEYLMPQEQIVFATNCTRHTHVDRGGVSLGKAIMGDYDISTHKDVICNEATLLIISNFRWIRVSLSEYQYSREVRIRKETSTMGKLFSESKLKYYWKSPPENPQKWFKKMKASPREYITRNINVFLLSDIYPYLEARRLEYKLHDQKAFPNGSFHLMIVALTSGSYSMQYDEGLKLHELLQLASIHQGRIPLITVTEKQHIKENDSEETIVQKLSYLNQLLDQGLITTDEYQKKKEYLLDNL